MYGHIRNSGIEGFRNYNEALLCYEQTTDIARRVKEPKKPLGHRKNVDAYSIRKEEDGTIACYLYASPVVRFKPDGDILVRDYHYPTMSTSNFIAEVFAYQVSSRLFDNTICISVGGKEARLNSDIDTVLRRSEQGSLQIVKSQTEKRIAVVRGMSNFVRKEFDVFTKYCEGVIKLRGIEPFSIKEYEDTFGKVKDPTKNWKSFDMPQGIGHSNSTTFVEDINTLLAWMRDDGGNKHLSHYKALLTIANAFGKNAYGNGWVHTGYLITMPTVNTAIKNIAMGVHRDKVFNLVESQGTIRREKYKEYFSGGWNKFHEQVKT